MAEFAGKETQGVDTKRDYELVGHITAMFDHSSYLTVSTATMSLGLWALDCRSCSAPRGSRTRAWDWTHTVPTQWVYSCRRQTSSATTSRTWNKGARGGPGRSGGHMRRTSPISHCRNIAQRLFCASTTWFAAVQFFRPACLFFYIPFVCLCLCLCLCLS
jgi:hypothetical protein